MMAHEFNNLMTPVVSYARYALDNDDVELMKKALEMTLKQASTVSAMSERILGLAIHEGPRPARVPIAEAIKEAAACLCRDPEKDGVTQRVDIPEDLIVWADERQLRQVFFNLLLNARQAIQHRNGRIIVTAEPADDGRVAINIKDNGCGIDPANLENIFEPFFTTKTGNTNGQKRGTGLGLPLCKDIIEEQRGQISVQSEPGHGTTFTITLPAEP
ncbi:MAG: sensor histidine kinase, partial [Phycisphaerae bacterium]